MLTGGRAGEGSGGGAGKRRHASFHSIMPVEGVLAGASAVLAGLQPLQGTWSLGLSFKIFLFIHNDPKGERKREKSAATMKRDESCERKKPISCVAIPIPPAPTVIKNRILDRFL